MTSQKGTAERPAGSISDVHIAADTFSARLLKNRKERAQRPAIREKRRGIWHTMTWRDLADEAAALAAALDSQGLERGTHVVLLGENRPRLYAAICAVHALGAVAVPLYQDASSEEIVPLVNRVKATHIFAENQEQVDKVLTVLQKMPSVTSVVYDADRGMRHYRQPQLTSYGGLLARGRESIAARPDFLERISERGTRDDPAFVFFTSGSTGPAKPVVLTHAGLIDRALAVAQIEKFDERDVVLAYLPPGWMAQSLYSYVLAVTVGYCVCCPESSETMVADMREIGPTIFLAPPRVLDALMTQVSIRIADASRLGRGLYTYFMRVAQNAVRRELAGTGKSNPLRWIGNLLIYGPIRDMLGMSRVRVAYTTGDAVDPELVIFFRALGVNLKQLYGSTEAAFLIAMHRDGDIRLDSVGVPVDGVELRLSEEQEILVRSPGVLREYLGDTESTRSVRTSGGWLRTGDVGRIGDDGHVRVLDSLANIGTLNSGSLFAPRPIENKLKFFPYIREAVVFGNGQDIACALVDIDTSAVGRWADQRGISYTGNADLASRDEVYELIGECIAKINRELAADDLFATSQIHRFAVLPKELSSDDGVLTRTGKPQRSTISARFKAVVEAMYAGRDEVPFNVDGSGPDADSLKIRNALVSAKAKSRKAA